MLFDTLVWTVMSYEMEVWGLERERRDGKGAGERFEMRMEERNCREKRIRAGRRTWKFEERLLVRGGSKRDSV